MNTFIILYISQQWLLFTSFNTHTDNKHYQRLPPPPHLKFYHSHDLHTHLHHKYLYTYTTLIYIQSSFSCLLLAWTTTTRDQTCYTSSELLKKVCCEHSTPLSSSLPPLFPHLSSPCSLPSPLPSPLSPLPSPSPLSPLPLSPLPSPPPLFPLYPLHPLHPLHPSPSFSFTYF